MSLADFVEQRHLLQQLIKRVDLSKNGIRVSIRRQAFLQQVGINLDQFDDKVASEVLVLKLPIQLKRRGVETKLIIGGETQNRRQDPILIQSIARGHVWFEQLVSGRVESVLEIAERENRDAGDISRILPLAFLAPKLVRAILDGRQPIELTADALKRHSASLPLCWEQQAAVLGFLTQT